MARRGRSEGSVFRQRGKWVARIRYTRPIDSHENQGSVQRTFDRQKDAIAALSGLKEKADLLAAAVPGVVPNEDRLFLDWSKEWHENRVRLRRISGKTEKNEARAIKRLSHGVEYKNQTTAGLGTLRLGEISVHRVDRFFHAVEGLWIDEPSGRLRTRQQMFTALRKCLADAKLRGGNPCAEADRPRASADKSRDKTLDVFSTKEMTSILGVRDGQYGALFSFLLLTGTRIGEALALQWKDVDLKACVVTVEASLSEASGSPQRKIPKTGRARSVSMPEALRARLSSLRNERGLMAQPRAYVFATALGTPLRQSNVMRREWFPLLDELKIRRRGFHACRHTHASRLLADRVPVTDVAKRLGHASPAVTMSIYAHAMPGQDEATARIVDQWSLPHIVDDGRCP